MKPVMKKLLCCVSLAVALVPLSALADLRVGAARIDVTPTKEQLPPSYLGVNDPVYARAIVIDNDGTRAALITLDAGGIPTPLWQSVSERLAGELGIAPEHMLLTATHTHSVPRQQAPDYVDKVVQSVSTAISKLQPAQMAWGTGLSWINVNRNLINPATGRWGEFGSWYPPGYLCYKLGVVWRDTAFRGLFYKHDPERLGCSHSDPFFQHRRSFRDGVLDLFL